MNETHQELLLAEAVLKRALKLRHETAMQAPDEEFKKVLAQPLEPYMETALSDIEWAASFIKKRSSS